MFYDVILLYFVCNIVLRVRIKVMMVQLGRNQYVMVTFQTYPNSFSIPACEASVQQAGIATSATSKYKLVLLSRQMNQLPDISILRISLNLSSTSWLFAIDRHNLYILCHTTNVV